MALGQQGLFSTIMPSHGKMNEWTTEQIAGY